MRLRQFVKILHTLSAIGYSGGLAAYLVVLISAPEIGSLEEHIVLRTTLAGVANWIIVPSMVVVLISGLLSMVVHYPFTEKLWVWIKAVSGLLIFEASLHSIGSPGRATGRAVEKAAAGEIDAAGFAALMHDEWGALWLLLGLAVMNVVIGIWRPNIRILR